MRFAAYFSRRLLQAGAVMLVAGAIAFALFRFVGDPVFVVLPLEATDAERALVREKLGLNDPVLVQYARFLADAVRGDFGRSYQGGEPVGELIARRLPATLELVFVSGLIATAAGVLLGVFTAVRRQSRATAAIMTVSLIGVSLPTFVIGVLLISVFSVQLGWLPVFGRGEVVDLGWWRSGLLSASGRESLILPALTLGLFQLTLVMRLVRAEMLEVLRQDFVRFARARGLPERRRSCATPWPTR